MRKCAAHLLEDSNKLLEAMAEDCHIYNTYFGHELCAQEQNDLVKLIADTCSKICVRFTDIDLMYVLEQYTEME